jgi:hypothetical protein
LAGAEASEFGLADVEVSLEELELFGEEALLAEF